MVSGGIIYCNKDSCRVGRLVNLERTELPICVGKVGRVVCHKICAIAWACEDGVSKREQHS